MAIPDLGPGPVVSPGGIDLTATAGTAVVKVKATGDSTSRITLGTDGRINLGTGAVMDVNLYRGYANVLATDDSIAAVDYYVGSVGGPSMPRGYVGYSEKTSNSSAIGSTQTDIGLSLSVYVINDRKYRVTALATAASSALDNRCVVRLSEGSTQRQNCIIMSRLASSGSASMTFSISYYFVSTADETRTFKLTGQVATGAGTMTVIAGTGTTAFLLVEDLGGPSGGA